MIGVYPMVTLALPLLADNLAANQAITGGSIATTSWGWQWQQARQWLGEWLELQFTASPLQGWDLPVWLPPLWVQQAILGFVLGALLGWLGLLSWQIAQRYYRQWQRRSRPSQIVPREEAAEVSLNVKAWLARSRQAQQQGRYPDACDALYHALLQHLDDTGTAPQLASRTDREYRHLLQAHPKFGTYQTVFDVHEQAHFGGLVISAETWQRCQPVYRELAAS